MPIQTGSKVSIHYKLMVDGQVVDSSEGQEPLTYTHGSSQVIPGLERHVAGMNKGDKSSVTIEPALAYGERNPQAIQKVPKTNFQDADKMQVGGVVTGTAGDQQFQAVITEITDTEVVLDMNHPLAGKTLNFDVELVDVEPCIVQ